MKKVATYSNLKINKKWKGIIDYKIAIFFLIYFLLIYNILNLLSIPILHIIYFLILSAIPIMGIYLTLNGEENMTEVLINISRFLISPKNYVYEYKDKFEQYEEYIKKDKLGKRVRY